ncbi:MAG: enoyl-CoA hydratase/isomerase family protein [Acidimicrobiales bacterium]
MEYPFEPELLVEQDGAVRIVTLHRPAVRNAVDPAMHTALAKVWGRLADDVDARAVVLRGSDGAFCAGGDLDLVARLQHDVPERRTQLREATEIVDGMVGCRLPVVAAVAGPAVGLGCSLAVLADVVYVAESAYLADPHVAIGLTAGDGGAAVWPVLASMVQAKEYLLTGDRIPAAEAVRLGLATRAVPDGELDETALAMARRLAALPAQAVQSTKQALNLHLERAVRGVLEYALAREYESFDDPEHRAAVARLRPR